MNKLVNNLLSLAKVEGMSTPAQKQTFDLPALIDEVMQSMEAVVVSRNLQIDKQVKIIEVVHGDEDAVRQVLTILYENALKYANEGGSVNVSVRQTKKSVVCTVKNTGQGIASKDLPHIFDRFYRADAARTNAEGSYGLGLSIAKSLAEQMGGQITAQSADGEWAEFTFTFAI